MLRSRWTNARPQYDSRASNTTTPVPVVRYSLDGAATYPVLQSLIAGIPAYRAAGLNVPPIFAREEWIDLPFER